MKITIIGAGPIGLETALYAKKLGHEISIIEKGDIGNNIKKWGHVTFFSPFYMNSSEIGREISKTDIDENEYCNGEKYINNYLRPIAENLNKNILLNTEVLKIAKKNILKGEKIGSKDRLKQPFVLYVKDKEKEYFLESDIVIDTSGTYDNPLNFGIGGLQIPNQKSFKEKINSYVPNLDGQDKSRYANKKTLLIGTGYSAATTANLFKNLIKEHPETHLYWFSRNDYEKPYTEIENDSLALRDKLIKDSNDIALNETNNIQFFNNSYIEKIEKYNEQLKVTYYQDEQPKEIIVDEIISNVGYKPDNSIYSELQVHECYASNGPMKLAATLLSSSSADCLNQTSAGADTLKNPEPDFYILGNKSYGRNSNFILKVGYQQIEDVFKLIG